MRKSFRNGALEDYNTGKNKKDFVSTLQKVSEEAKVSSAKLEEFAKKIMPLEGFLYHLVISMGFCEMIEMGMERVGANNTAATQAARRQQHAANVAQEPVRSRCEAIGCPSVSQRRNGRGRMSSETET